MSRRHPDKYFLYEQAVQSPDVNVEMYNRSYQEIFGKPARKMREDFCGTFAVCTEWVKMHPENTAVGLDLDPEPIEYGMRVHYKKLKPDQKKRVKILRKNVLSVTTPKSDLIVAGNFSFFIFKQRKQLLDYFRKTYESLGKQGLLCLDMVGGPGFLAPMRERKKVSMVLRHPPKKTDPKFTYIWHQQKYNPITHDGKYAIHFILPDGTRIENAFNYDWRIWAITEVRDALLEAGFADTCVYWETEFDGKGTGEYVKTEDGDNSYSWVAYVCGIKR